MLRKLEYLAVHPNTPTVIVQGTAMPKGVHTLGNPELGFEFKVGTRVKVNNAAGPRLGSQHGTVLGSGMYRNAVRIILDGAKRPITLHKKYLIPVEAPP